MKRSQESLMLRPVETDVEAVACYGLMRQLRPHLASATEFVARVRRQAAEGYHLIALREGTMPMALAGFRVQENLVHGRHLYVDDLVTDEAARSQGHGGLMMNHLEEKCRALRCDRILLDTPLANTLGHRFYYRNGLLATALRFAKILS
jgi:ribosomal protein S18 acetylase RimI-like enzyme